MKRLAPAIMLCVFLAACGTPTQESGSQPKSTKPKTTQAPKPKETTPSRPGDPAVYRRIEAMRDCDKLQEQFDIAAANHDRDIDRGAIDLAQIDTGYMMAADDRLREVGCYGG